MLAVSGGAVAGLIQRISKALSVAGAAPSPAAL